MPITGQAWTDELRAHIATLREEKPLPDRAVLDAAEERQCQVMGGTLLTWLRKIGPAFLQERQAMSGTLGIEPEALIVFTSTIPGLVAARQIIPADNQAILYLEHDEFAGWTRQHPDDEYRWHVHFWSLYRATPDQEFLARAQERYPLEQATETYWQHSEGTMWAKNVGRGVDHLWKWDGNEPQLLEEAFYHWVT